MSRPRRGFGSVWLLVIVVLAGACGVPTDGSADVPDADDVPFGLLDEEREPVTGPSPGRGTVVELFVYDPDEERLRAVRERLSETGLRDVLAALLDERDGSDDLRSALGGTEAIAGLEVEAGIATVELSEEFTDLSGSDQLIAIAQIVFTSTGRPGVGQVRFELDGASIEIPRGDGSITSGTVTRGDYADLAPSSGS